MGRKGRACIQVLIGGRRPIHDFLNLVSRRVLNVEG